MAYKGTAYAVPFFVRKFRTAYRQIRLDSVKYLYNHIYLRTYSNIKLLYVRRKYDTYYIKILIFKAVFNKMSALLWWRDSVYTICRVTLPTERVS